LTVQLPMGASSSVAGWRGRRGAVIMKETFRDGASRRKMMAELHLYKYTRKADAPFKAVTS
ncbi:MAG TPA: hypothetical protein PK441_14845, partial [Burkholderiaceae bacterium]|nr:hypothetical protein [Burkholderiaceae bacterium]